MQLMCTWLHNYIDKVDASKSYPSIELHRTFYALSQTVFYIFIFRHREIIQTNSSKSIDAVKSWKFSSIISSKMNPLRYCLPTITKKFASLARLYQLAYCYSIIDNNNRLTLPTLGDGSSSLTQNNSHNAGIRKFFNATSIDSSFSNVTSTVDKSQSTNLIHQDNPLDSFFPFDPYLLNRSKIHIENIYQYYSSVDDEDDEEEDDEEDDEAMSEDDDEDGEEMEIEAKKHHNPWSEDDENYE